MSEKVRITLRATREQVAAIDAAAKSRGLDRNAYILLRAAASVTDDSIVDGIATVLAGIKDEISEALAADLAAHAERMNGNLRGITDWMKRHDPGQSAPPAATTKTR